MYEIKLKSLEKKVINPITHEPLTKDGIITDRITTYWKQQETDGDVTITEQKKVKGDK